MSTIHYSNRTTHLTETEAAIQAASDAVVRHLEGTLADERDLRRPVPLAFLDDGRRLFLLIDAGRGRTADQPRSWGVEIVTDGDLVGENAGGQTAVRSTGRLTPTSVSSSIARSRASRRLTFWCRVIASAIWRPMVCTGLREDIGSW